MEIWMRNVILRTDSMIFYVDSACHIAIGTVHTLLVCINCEKYHSYIFCIYKATFEKVRLAVMV